MDAVVSVAPPKDLVNQEHICQMDMDVNECQVTISIQLTCNSQRQQDVDIDVHVVDQEVKQDAVVSPWEEVSVSTRNAFMNSFIEQILDVKERVYLDRFDFDFDNDVHGNNNNKKKKNNHQQQQYQQPSQDQSRGVLSEATTTSGKVITSRSNNAVTTQQPMPERRTSLTLQDNVSPQQSPPQHLVDKVQQVKTLSQKQANEAVHLRNYIASKEFELARLNKSLYNRKDSTGLKSTTTTTTTAKPSKMRSRSKSPVPPTTTTSPPTTKTPKITSKPSPVIINRSNSSTGAVRASPSTDSPQRRSKSPPSTKQEALEVQQQVNHSIILINEINMLKDKYYNLTGNDYDKRKRPRRTSKGGMEVNKDVVKDVVNDINSKTISSNQNNNNTSSNFVQIPMTPAAKCVGSYLSSKKSYHDHEQSENQSISTSTQDQSFHSTNEVSLMNLKHPPYWTMIR